MSHSRETFKATCSCLYVSFGFLNNPLIASTVFQTYVIYHICNESDFNIKYLHFWEDCHEEDAPGQRGAGGLCPRLEEVEARSHEVLPLLVGDRGTPALDLAQVHVDEVSAKEI